MIKNREPGDKKSDSFLHINSCKVQAPFGKEITCHRPKGRLDYQLTYLLNGDFEVVYNGESKRISEGFVLLPPNCPNLYTDFADTRRIYVHFSGIGVESILADANIKCGVYSLPFSPIVENMFARLIAEHNRREPVSLENGQLIYILYTLGKQQSSQRLPSDDVQDAVTYITTHFSDKIHIDGLAISCKLSSSHFMHLFKEQTGFSPVAYQKMLRIESAKSLLISSHLSVSQISEQVGYPDPLYFSRVFKKSTRMSPKEYREKPTS